jgi:DNA-binding response OmpR family regulator
MSAITVHLARPSDHGTSSWSPSDVRLVPPGQVPDGAVVLGVVVAVPGDGPAPSPARAVRPLAAVSAPVATAGPDDVVQFGPGLRLDRWRHQVTRDQRPIELTRREYALLEHLVTHSGRVFSRRQLLAAAWNLEDDGSVPSRTVDVHASRLRRKLGAPHGGALENLRGVGYRWALPVEPAGGQP